MGKKALANLLQVEREGLAVSRARVWSPTIHSRARARRRSKGWNYNFRGTRGDKSITRVKVRKIDQCENWQFGSDAPIIDGPPVIIERWRYYMPPIEKAKKLAEKLENEKSFNEIMQKIASRNKVKIGGNVEKFLDSII